MVTDVQYLTPEGMENLEKRLNYLVTVRRQEVADRLKQAVEDGGELIENSEYEDAKNEQAFVEGEIARIDRILRNAKVIEETGVTDEVLIGSHVTVVEDGTDDDEVYRLVGPAEANPRQGKISIESPLGKALLGAKVGDNVTFKAPDGKMTFVIRSIE